ncbi:MAG: cation:dicarboxylase symporter family transporter [Pseudomonadota bacterium]
MIGAILGIISGWFFGPAMSSFAWIGALFLDALKMMIIPLIVAAVISGVTSLGDIRKLGTLGGMTIAYYATTTALAVFIGLIVVNIIQPGSSIEQLSEQIPEIVSEKEGVGFIDIIRSMISPNIVTAANDMQLLPIIIFCLLFAAAMTTVGEKGETLIRFFDGLNDTMMKLVIWIMWFAPLGIFALIAGKIGDAGGGEALLTELSAVGAYCLTVILGLSIHFGQNHRQTGTNHWEPHYS